MAARRLSALRARIRSRLRGDPYVPRVRMRRHRSLRHLGTPYGGWTFAEVPALQGCVVISCGLGEDASFDVEFASAYGAEIVLVDPTPRAIEHFRAIEHRLGKPAETSYVAGGKQPPQAYDLRRLVPGQLRLVEKAVSDTVGTVRFYAPRDPAHVSHSIVNFQNDYSASTPFIEVESVDIGTLISQIDESRLQIVKLDVEGAEGGVLRGLMALPFRPPQICVEFDELGARTSKGRQHFDESHRLLSDNGYAPASFDGHANFLYLHASLG